MMILGLVSVHLKTMHSVIGRVWTLFNKLRDWRQVCHVGCIGCWCYLVTVVFATLAQTWVHDLLCHRGAPASLDLLEINLIVGFIILIKAGCVLSSIYCFLNWDSAFVIDFLRLQQWLINVLVCCKADGRCMHTQIQPFMLYMNLVLVLDAILEWWELWDGVLDWGCLR